MQAVDRFDQLMSLYSLAKRHAFKKWYLKLTMALLDVGMINAEIHYFMVNPDEKKGMHRYNYREKLCSQLFDTDWSLYEGMTNNDALEAMNEGQQRKEDSDEETTTARGTKRKKRDGDVVSCTPLMVNQYITTNPLNEDTEETPVKTYKGVCCQVCSFEGRKTRTKSVAFCCNHGIRACLTTPNLMSYKNEKFQNAVAKSTDKELAMWRCPDVSDSCWSKAHSFYIQQGLWGQGSPVATTNDNKTFRHHGVKVSSMLYKKKEDWMLKHRLISKKGGTRGRKSMKQTTSSTTEPSTSQPKKRQRQNEITNTDITSNVAKVSGGTVDDTNSDNWTNCDDASDQSHDSRLPQITQQVAV